MNTDFKEVMSLLPDEELIKIVTIQRDGYKPLAVEEAEEEIKKRGIDTSRVEAIKSTLEEAMVKQKEFNSKRVNSLIRLFNFLIDSAVILIISAIIGFIIGEFYKTDDRTIIQFIICILIVVVFCGYYIFLEYKYQKTLGKLITKTRVMKADGERAQLVDIIERTFFRLIPLDRVSYLFTSNGFHDWLSKTTVIKDKKENI